MVITYRLFDQTIAEVAETASKEIEFYNNNSTNYNCKSMFDATIVEWEEKIEL